VLAGGGEVTANEVVEEAEEEMSSISLDAAARPSAAVAR
jgi:hypothetical protein